MAVDPDVVAHYEFGLEETRLFLNGVPRLEYQRTLELLGRLLPPAPARVLDVGGGTGVYAIPLCEQGYTVHLVDPVTLHVDRAASLARQHHLGGLTASLGDARDLTSVGTGYDAVLLLGPLYHLIDYSDRCRAFSEAARVARPGGVIVAVGISRYASLVDGLKNRLLSDPTFRAIVERDLRDGQHRNPDLPARPEFFTTAYFHLPHELQDEARAGGLQNVQLFSIEGPAWMFEGSTTIEEQMFAARATESEPALMAATSHIMAAGSTPAS